MTTNSISTTDAGFYFDEAAADRVCRFFESRLTHFEGRWAGKAFILLDWQRQILRDVFGWKRADGTRRYRTVYVEVPRKNGKSIFAAGIALYLLAADGEAGAQVYSVAANTSQASITFDAAKKMTGANAALSKRIDVQRWHLAHPKSGSVYKALSGENVGSHGKNTHGLILDEFHEWTSPGSRELFSALVTSQGARSQPLTIIITTAGNTSDDSMCLDFHHKAERQAAGDCADDTFYSVIFSTAKPWDDEAGWQEANPSLGHTITIDYLRAEAVKARESAQYQNAFRRLYLDQWTEQTTRWLSLETWDACTAHVEPPADTPAYVGLDLSTTYDLTAAVWVWPMGDKWLVVPRLYCPNATAQKRWKEDGTPLPQWIADGYVIGTDRPTIDYDRIEADIIAAQPIQELSFDPYNASSIVSRLEKSGIVTTPTYQTFRGMNAACKELERRLISGSIIIADNPAYRWMAQNVEVETDRHGNIRPVKPKRKGSYAGTRGASIDGIVALVVAISRLQLMGNAPPVEANEIQIAVF